MNMVSTNVKIILNDTSVFIVWYPSYVVILKSEINGATIP
jgi:hypothetical protein